MGSVSFSKNKAIPTFMAKRHELTIVDPAVKTRVYESSCSSQKLEKYDVFIGVDMIIDLLKGIEEIHKASTSAQW